jgi:ribonuclease HI
MEIKIYTDGACVGNPGPGGWAAIVLLENEKKELFGGERLTTNNRMELMAAIKALEYCVEQEKKQPSLKHVKIFTDSTYVKDGITVWINTWEKNNWKTSDKKNVKNIDLWKRLKELVKSNRVEWNWVKGHSEDPMNDLADKLAKKATPV